MNRVVVAAALIAAAIGLTASEPHATTIAEQSPAGSGPLVPTPPDAPLPAALADTGLYVPGTTQVAPGRWPFAPQYPLWTDGMAKRRWLALPPGTFIDAADADAWQFPPGTRLWKEFGTDRPVETRFIERRADGAWRFATYVWNEQGTQALLAPPAGATVRARGLPNDRHGVPGQVDCLACHDAGAGAVLGVSALQLSPARDPAAPHGDRHNPLDLRVLVSRGLVRNLPPTLLDSPPTIAATSSSERAALGYLHGNCGHCHNDAGDLAPLSLSLAQSAVAPARSAQRSLASLLGHASRFRAHGGSADARVVPGRAQDSVLLERMRTTNALARMPPIGVQIPDPQGVALIEQWINQAVDSGAIAGNAPPTDPGARSEQASQSIDRRTQ